MKNILQAVVVILIVVLFYGVMLYLTHESTIKHTLIPTITDNRIVYICEECNRQYYFIPTENGYFEEVQ